jgi:L-erythro-3,5-diaminohexanoate dehydrogenase
MKPREIKGGNPFGAHRVLVPKRGLPQPAEKLDNDMSRIFDNEILVDVDLINIDAASFAQIRAEANDDDKVIVRIILDIVGKRGKMQNPVTGSGGMFIGRVAALGSALENVGVGVGDPVASLVSLSLTPLFIDEIIEVRKEIDQVAVVGQAVLFESGILVRLPDDIPAPLALAVLDVAGAPAQTRRLVTPGQTVAVVGATGKSGILCVYEAVRRAGPKGRVIGIGYLEEELARLASLNLCETVAVDARDALACHERLSTLTGGRLADVVINCVNVPNTEMGSILMCRDGGTIYFFSMATSFSKAALGAEGVGKDVTMLVGNGYARGHAEMALDILRDAPSIRALYEEIYAR